MQPKVEICNYRVGAKDKMVWQVKDKITQSPIFRKSFINLAAFSFKFVS